MLDIGSVVFRVRDLAAQEQAAEVERLKALGARLVHWEGRPDDADYLLTEDPCDSSHQHS